MAEQDNNPARVRLTDSGPKPVEYDTNSSTATHFFKADVPIEELAKPIKGGENYLKDTRVARSHITGNIIDHGQFGKTDITASVPDALGSYTKYGFTPNTFIGDAKEFRARRQSNAEKVTNGFKKSGVTFAASMLENLSSLPAAIYEGIDKKPGTSNLWDNPIGRLADSMKGWSEEKYKNYNTNEYEQKTAVEKLGSKVYWANEILDGFAYSFASMATALIPSAVKFMPMTRGMKIAGKLMNKANKAKTLEAQYKLFKNLQYNRAGVNSTNSMGQKLIGPKSTGAPKVSQIQTALDNVKANNIAKYTKAVEQIESATMMSMAESSVEARESRDVYIESTLAEEAERLGVDMEDLSPDLISKVNEEGRTVGNSVFAFNMAVLSLSNGVMFHKAIKSGAGMPKSNLYQKVMSRAGFKDAAGNPIKGTVMNKLRGYPGGIVPGGGKTTMYNAFDEMSVFRKALHGAKQVGKEMFKSGPTELLQENLQLQASHGVVDYHTDKHFDAGTEDIIKSFNEAFSYSFGSEEGKESMLIGFIVGSIMGGAGELASKIRSPKTKAAEKKAIQEVMNMYNSGLMDNPLNAVNKSMYQGTIIQEMEAIQNALFGTEEASDDLDPYESTPSEPGLGEIEEGSPLGLKEGAEGTATNLVTPGKGFRVGKGRRIIPAKGESAPGTTEKVKFVTGKEEETKRVEEEKTTKEEGPQADPNETISDEEFAKFTKNFASGSNDISRKRAINLGEKIKKGIPLSPREKVMYNSKEEYIDKLLLERDQEREAKEYYQGNPNRALRRLEELSFKLLQEEAIFHLERGTFDLFLRKLEDAKGLSDTEFEKAFMVSKDMMEAGMKQVIDAAGKTQKESAFLKDRYVDNIIERSKKLQSQHEKINLLYPEFERGSNLTDIEKIDEQMRYEKWVMGKQVLYRHATYLDYLDDVIDRAAEDLASLHPDINVEELKNAIVEDFFGASILFTPEGEPISPKTIEQITKDGMFEPSKYSLLDEQGESVEYKGYLRDVYDDILKNDPISKKLFQSVFSELVKQMSDKEEILSTFEQLITSDEALEDYIEKKEGREYVGKTKRRKAKARRVIDGAETPQDIEDLKNTGEIPPEMEAEAEAKLAELRKQKNVYRKELLKMSLEELRAMNTEDFPPLKQDAYDEVVTMKEDFESSGQADPYVVSPEKRGADKKGKKGEKSKKDTKEAKDKAKKEAGENPENTGEDTEPGDGDPDTTIDDTVEEIDPRAVLKAVVRPNVVMAKDSNSKIYKRNLIVSDDGERNLTVPYTDLDGNLIEIKDYLLHTPDVVEQRVEFVIIETQEYESNTIDADWKKKPIFVKLGDDIVGVLMDYSSDNPSLTQGRETIYRHLTTGNQAFATIKSSELTNRSNINNARTKDGGKYFSNPQDVFGNILSAELTTDDNGDTVAEYYQKENAKPILAIPVGFGNAMNIKVVDNNVTLVEKVRIEKDLEEEVSEAMKAKKANYLVGQPIFVAINPATGKYQSIVGSTQNLTDDAVNAVLEAITDKDLLKVQDIVGLTYPNINSATDSKFFGIAKFTQDPTDYRTAKAPAFFLNDPDIIQNVEKWFEDNKEVLQIYFHSATAAAATGAPTTLIKIDNNNLAAALEGKEDFQFALVEPTSIESGDGEGVNIKFAKSSIDPASEIETIKEIKNNLVKDFKELLAQKKFQVSAERVASNAPFTSPVTGQPYDSYQDYLFSENEMSEQGAARGDEGRGGLGHLSILATDVKNINGSVFSNPRLTFVDLGTTETPKQTKTADDIANETTDMGDNLNKEDEKAAAIKAEGRGKRRGSAPDSGGPQSGSTTDLSDLVGSKTGKYDVPTRGAFKQPQQNIEVTKKEAIYEQALKDFDLTDRDSTALLKKINDPSVTPEEYQEIIDHLNCPF